MKAGVSTKWRKLFALIPGYGPIATADGCWFDEAAAQLAIDFFHERLTHIEGTLAGKPFLLEQWQMAIVGCLFGWKRPDGSRRYRESLIFIPRKNGKTPLAAGIANLVLFLDEERGQQNICVAGEREQAALLFRHVKGMIENSPDLSNRARIYKATGMRSIETAKGFFRVMSADADTKHGGNLHLGIVDELHVQPNRDLVDVIQTSMASANRRHPLLIHITTSDFERPGSICNEKHDYASKVRDGIIKDVSFLPVIFEAARDDDWADPKVWAKANPNLGVSVSLDYLKRECQRAKDTPGYENTFKRLHLNMRTEQATRWLSMERWDACSEPLPDLMGMPCFAGLDLASTTDVAAWAGIFPLEEGRYAVQMRFWIAEENARMREKRDRVPYPLWAQQGLITLTPGNVIDYDFIRRDINQMKEVYDIQEIAVDRWNATQITTQLEGDGFKVVPFGQGFASLSAPTKELEKLVISLKFLHAGNEVLRWMASNVAVEHDAAGNIKPSKRRSTEKIDGIVACCMGLGRALVRDENAGKSVYDTRGIDVF